ncbi:response regulator transcription factor [Vibrio bivalvicida]|uniref:Two-component system response regulator n=1 Tax=Vibrio bivalvicida TaxID=1276888 RepID=A0A177Y2X3_9VIBR|nr:response regulator transcription factor [Vibrio bivalvicida]OAJ95180.1 two-component system response regulator [Vibrio bivalvicida]
MNSILLVEDDHLLGQGVKTLLQSNGYQCTWVTSAKEANKHWFSADLVVLDRQLQDGDSLRHLPNWLQTKALPVIVLTAKVEVEQRVEGLMSGAKDYMTKPFAQEELLARIVTHLRPLGSSAINYKTLSIDVSTRVIHNDGTPINLKPKEFQLLVLLVQNQGRVFHREELLNKIWGYQAFPTTRTVDNHILRLRNAIPCLAIETHRGIGYRLVADS